MVAFHYPPMRGSSGLQRTLKFGNYLPEFGWQTTVLSASSNAYSDTAPDQLRDIAPTVQVHRAWCIDAARHLSVRGAYPRFTALPDRWVSWAASAIPLGLLLCQRLRPAVVWSTFPIATGHLIGAALNRLTGIPWVADLRDSMTENDYPRDARVRAAHRRVEARIMDRAAAVVFTAPSTLKMYATRYPHARSERWSVIPNGYDEANFAAAERLVANQPTQSGLLTLVHSGLLDPVDRDPRLFFDALADLKSEGHIDGTRVRVILRATGHDALYGPQIAARGLTDVVHLAAPLPYVQALAEMLTADGLLLFQASNCNHQIPAKLYEYFRARRPVLCLTDPAGDTAAEARAGGIDFVLHLHDRAALRDGLRAFVRGDMDPDRLRATEHAIQGSSRKGRAARLADVLNEVVSA